MQGRGEGFCTEQRAGLCCQLLLGMCCPVQCPCLHLVRHGASGMQGRSCHFWVCVLGDMLHLCSHMASPAASGGGTVPREANTLASC
jgi:hypothetical protein